MNISPVELPLNAARFVTSTQGIIAKKRVGKSYTGSVEAEELLEAKHHIVVIDPTGAWYGLRSNAAGDGPGYPIAVFGGDHGDAPLAPTSGRAMAEAIVADRFSCILDVSGFELGQDVEFVADFLETFYRRNRQAVHLFVDEADIYVPQQLEDKAQKRSAAAMNAIVRRGGIKGIGCTMITQRAAVISKNVISMVDMLTILQTLYPPDIDTIRTWVKVHASEEAARDMFESLPTLHREAWLWSPDLKLFQRVPIRARRTFDSGRTPEAGEVVAPPRVLAQVDVARLGESIAAAAAQALDADPEALRAELAKSRRELAAARAELASRPLVAPEVLDALAEARARIGYAAKALAPDRDLDAPAPAKAPTHAISGGKGLCGETMTGLHAGVLVVEGRRNPAAVRHVDCPGCREVLMRRAEYLPEHDEPIEIARARPLAEAKPARKQRDVKPDNIVHRDTKPPNPNEVGESARRLLNILAYGELDSVTLAIAGGYSHTGGGYRVPKRWLADHGLIEGGTVISITKAGRKAIGKPDAPPTAESIRDGWLKQLNPCAQSILLTVLDRGPTPAQRVADAAGYQTNGGGWRIALKSLRTRGLVTVSDVITPHPILTTGIRP